MTKPKTQVTPRLSLKDAFEDERLKRDAARREKEEAVQLLVNGFVKDVLQELPMEFAVEAQKLVAISLEGSVG